MLAQSGFTTSLYHPPTLSLGLCEAPPWPAPGRGGSSACLWSPNGDCRNHDNFVGQSQCDFVAGQGVPRRIQPLLSSGSNSLSSLGMNQPGGNPVLAQGARPALGKGRSDPFRSGIFWDVSAFYRVQPTEWPTFGTGSLHPSCQRP